VSDVARHYGGADPLARVKAALDRLSPDGERITPEQLGGFDDFHTAGRVATVRLAELLAPSAGQTVLDAGCGLGGPARYLADQAQCRVIGVDLTPEFVAVARLLNQRTGMTDRVEIRLGDITALDLDDASVDHVWTQHAAMNIADRDRLYRETRRVMRPGGRFALYDVIDGGGGELRLPVPWATRPEHSHLVTRERLREHLRSASFTIDRWEEPTGEMIEAVKKVLAGPPDGVEPPLLGGRLFIEDIATKMATYVRNVEEGRTALAMVVCTAV
jgi:SAM-dependent methyltransferase